MGTELLGGDRTDTNSLWLAPELARDGIELQAKHVVGDDRVELAAVVRAALSRGPRVLIVTGGLGPTEDDVTRDAIADVLRAPLREDPRLVAKLQERFQRFGMPMPAINRRQALVPRGAEVIENRAGTAPGLLMSRRGAAVLLLPGPPREMKAVWEAARPRLLSHLPRGPRPVTVHHRLNVVGLTESRVDEIAAPIYRRHRHVRTTILFSPAGIELHLAARGERIATARRRVATLAAALRTALGTHVASEGEATLEQVVVVALRDRGETVALAESCTGGLVGHRLTQVPGASAVFPLGIVAYANQAKTDLLGVRPETLREHGAVSAEAVTEMAESVRSRGGTTWGIAVSGIAGPDGGTSAKPVGTTFVALAGPTGTKAVSLRLPGGREQVKWLASQAALNVLRLSLLPA